MIVTFSKLTFSALAPRRLHIVDCIKIIEMGFSMFRIMCISLASSCADSMGLDSA